MDNQQVMEMLSEIEEYFFYRKNNPEELQAFWSILVEMHEAAKTLVCQWHNLTGCSIK